MNRLNKLYAKILKATRCSVDDDTDQIMISVPSDRKNPIKPLEVPLPTGGMGYLYLPTDRALDTIDHKRVYFHPACESHISGEALMTQILRAMLRLTLYTDFRVYCSVALSIGESKTLKTSTRAQLESMKVFKDLTKKQHSDFSEIIKLIKHTKKEDDEEDFRIVNFPIFRGGVSDEAKTIHFRCVPKFPFYQHLKTIVDGASESDIENDEIKINGDSLSYRAALCVLRVFELVIPSITEPSKLIVTTVNQTAGRMTVMLNSYALILSEINAFIGRFSREFSQASFFEYNLEWVESLEKLPELATLVQSMKYCNYGKVDLSAKKTSHDAPKVLEKEELSFWSDEAPKNKSEDLEKRMKQRAEIEKVWDGVFLRKTERNDGITIFVYRCAEGEQHIYQNKTGVLKNVLIANDGSEHNVVGGSIHWVNNMGMNAVQPPYYATVNRNIPPQYPQGNYYPQTYGYQNNQYGGQNINSQYPIPAPVHGNGGTPLDNMHNPGL